MMAACQNHTIEHSVHARFCRISQIGRRLWNYKVWYLPIMDRVLRLWLSCPLMH